MTSDQAFLRRMLDAEAALARAQARLGIVPAAAADGVSELCEKIGIDVVELARRARGAGNPVVPLVTELRAADTSLSPYIHRGATSQDIVDTALMGMAARAREVILADLGRTLDALARLAGDHRETPMAGRTLGQHAVPVTFGVKAAGWLMLVLDARSALGEVRLPAQLGGAAGTLEGLGPAGLADVFADELGLARAVLPWHSRRTAVAGLGAALATTAGALGKVASDVVLLAQNEVGEVAEPAAPGRGGSSAMPHKRNPVLSILVRSVAAQVPALAQILQSSLVSEHERATGAWHAEWLPFRECLRLTGGAAETAAELCAGLEIFPERMRANLGVTGELSGGLGASGDLVSRALEEYRGRR